jgi:uncharacterized NAD(P)/FAD-binding protein YdhS
LYWAQSSKHFFTSYLGMIKLAIIGGGPSAVSIIEAVSQNQALRGCIDITVFEAFPRLWHGQPFQPDGDEVLANVPMTGMSLRADDREYGVRWLRDHGYHAYTSESSYPPRWLVGQYLQDCAGKAIERLEKSGSRVRVEMLAVTGLESREEKLWARCNDRKIGPFDQAVLCLGTSPPHDPYQLSGTPGYVYRPYPLRSSLAGIPQDASVAIVGSGLTAVDTVMALRARAHQGPITLVSRTGTLPTVRSSSVRHEYKYLNKSQLETVVDREGELRLTDIIALLKAELDSVGIDINALTADLANNSTPVRQLRSDLERARKGDPGWTLARNGIIGSGKDSWYLLREEDKAIVKSYHQILMRQCCPMPLSTGERLLEMFDAGQLDLIRKVTSIHRNQHKGSGFEVIAERNISADIVIGASTSAAHEPASVARPLVNSLIAQGLATPNLLGGLRVERNTARLLNEQGVSDHRLHALGGLTSGDFLFTFGIVAIVAHADSIVRDIATAVRSASKAPSYSTQA